MRMFFVGITFFKIFTGDTIISLNQHKSKAIQIITHEKIKQMNCFTAVVTFLSCTFLLNTGPVHAKIHHVLGENSNEVHGPSKGGSRNLRVRSRDNLNAMSRPSTNVKDESRNLIVGGAEIQEGEYPYLAFLHITSSDGRPSLCGGTLIKPNWILTAAHCVDGAIAITAGLGAHNVSDVWEPVWEPGVELHLISQDDIHIYPGWDSRRIDGDFALLYLSNGSNKTAAVLNTDIFVPAEKETVWVSGWGNLSPDAYYMKIDYTSAVPMGISLEVVGRDACELTYADFSTKISVTNDMLCATAWGAGASCHGDSGGPVIMKDPNGDHSKDVLVGVVSWALGCGEFANRPDVYGRVSSALSWFLSMMPSAMELRLATPAPTTFFSSSPSPSPMSL